MVAILVIVGGVIGILAVLQVWPFHKSGGVKPKPKPTPTPISTSNYNLLTKKDDSKSLTSKEVNDVLEQAGDNLSVMTEAEIKNAFASGFEYCEWVVGGGDKAGTYASWLLNHTTKGTGCGTMGVMNKGVFASNQGSVYTKGTITSIPSGYQFIPINMS